MKGQYKTASVVGRLSGSFWVDTGDFMLAEAREGNKLERASVVMVVRAGSGYVNLGAFGREVMKEVKKIVSETNIDELEEVKARFSEMVGKYCEVELEVVVGGFCGNEVLLVGCGDGGVSLYRGQELGQVLSVNQGVGVVRGKIKAGDVLVLGSGNFYNRVSYGDFKGVLAGGGGVEEVAQRLVVKVGEERVGSAVAAVVVRREEVVATQNENLPKIGQRIAGWWRKLMLPGVYIRGRGAGVRRKKLGAVVAVVLTTLLLLSVFLSWRSGVKRAREEAVAAVVGPVQERLDEAKSIQGINRLRARELLATARAKLMEGVNQFEEKSGERKLVEKLLSQVEIEYEKVSGEKQVIPEVFLDLGLVSTGFVGGVMAVDGDRLVVLDTNKSVVLEIDSESKQAKVVAGSGVGGSVLVAAGSLGNVVLAGNGVVKVGDGEEKLIIPKDEVWEEMVGLGVFGNNVYMLDRGLGEIWKYVPQGDMYSRRRWLAPSVEPDFSEVVDMVIDGDVWVLNRNGEVRKYSGGVPKGVGLTGLITEITQAQSVWVSGERVWVLDRGGKRIVGFDREGVYQEQLEWEGLGLVSDMVAVGEGEGEKLLLVSGEKVYEILVN